MDLALAITYGARMDELTGEFAQGLLGSIHAVTIARSSTIAWRPFVRLLRIWPQSTSVVIEAEKVRRKHIDHMYNQYLQKVADGNKPTCIVSSLSADKLTLAELHGTCVSLLQAAPDTIASGIYQCVAWLCSPEGQPFQLEAVKEILETYNGDRDEAWRMSFREERVPLMVSLYKETLRFFATAPFSGRRATKDINILGTKIPKGIAVVMNIQALNHDKTHYGDDAYSFNPRRFMGNNEPSPHMSYGVGTRICPAYQISNRIIYAMLTRLLLAFDMKQVEGTRLPNTDMIDFSAAYGLVAFPRGYDCSFTARNESWLKEKLASSEV
jgi:phenylacetate 2-hydroxylase